MSHEHLRRRYKICNLNWLCLQTKNKALTWIHVFYHAGQIMKIPSSLHGCPQQTKLRSVTAPKECCLRRVAFRNRADVTKENWAAHTERFTRGKTAKPFESIKRLATLFHCTVARAGVSINAHMGKSPWSLALGIKHFDFFSSLSSSSLKSNYAIDQTTMWNMTPWSHEFNIKYKWGFSSCLQSI